MGYNAVGVLIEGIWIDPINLNASILGDGILQRSQNITIGSDNHNFIPNVLASIPQLSATEVDIFNSKIRAGSISIKINAKDPISTRLLSQNISRKPNAVFDNFVPFNATSARISGVPAVDSFLYVGEEVIKIIVEISPGEFDIARGCGGTTASDHSAGDGLYLRPNYWIGRTVEIVLMDFAPGFNHDPSFTNTPTSVAIIWRGFLTAAPASVMGTNTIELRADDILSSIARVTVNKLPFLFSRDKSVLGFLTSEGVVGSYGPLINEDSSFAKASRVYKDAPFVAAASTRPVQVGSALCLAYGPNIQSSARLGSPSFVVGERVSGPFRELAVFSKRLDDLSFSLTSQKISPTKACPHPYHPLTIAAALLFSTRNTDQADTSRYDVMHPQFSAGLDYLLDKPSWDAMIAKTSGIEIDDLILGWDGGPVRILETIIDGVLSAYGFALVMSPAGFLIPIQVGLASIEDFVNAPLLQPLPEYFEWRNIGSDVLDQVVATLGALPWAEGRKVVVNGTSVRTDVGGRSTRLTDAAKTEYNYPTVSSSNSQTYALSNLLNRLIWRFDGLPQITVRLPATSPLFCGQWVRLDRPDGLITPLLYDLAGNRVEDWTSVMFFGQILSCRPVLDSQFYEVKLILTNYVFGRLAKYRSPACRIKTFLGSGAYLIEGLTSDFGTSGSDAFTFNASDQVEVYSKNLAATFDYRIVVSVTPSGNDAIIQLDSSFGTADPGDWIVLAPANIYTNGSRYGAAFPFPFVNLTNAAALDRPGPATDVPDTFA